MGDDEDRDAILKRRRRLIALTLAGLTSTATACGGGEEPPPQPCLTPISVDETDPQVCLSMEVPPDVEEDDAGVEVTPVPCLTPPMQPEDEG